MSIECGKKERKKERKKEQSREVLISLSLSSNTNPTPLEA
jgi:hypothetical protein